jgi:hypothetical protein
MPTGLGCLPLVEPFPALSRVVVPSFCLSRFHLPASLGSTSITSLLRYYGGSVTSRAQFFGFSTDHERCFLSRFVIPDSYCSNFRPFYLQPPYAFLSFCSLCSPGIGRGIVAPPLRDGFRSWLRHRKGGLANASGRIEFNVVLFMDWSFASGCSPPRLSTAQLPSATDRPVFPSGKDFHPSVGAYFQAHLSQALRAGLRSGCPYGTRLAAISQQALTNVLSESRAPDPPINIGPRCTVSRPAG